MASEVPDLKPHSAIAAQYPPKPIGTISGFEIYLTDYAREAIEMAESPVHMLIDIMSSDKDAYMRTVQLSDLQNFLSVYFLADVVAGIICYYDELASLWPIPRSYLSKYSLAELAESVALELHASSSRSTPATLSSTGGSSAGVQGTQGGHSGGHGGQGGQRDGQQGDQGEGRGGQGGQEGRGDRRGRGGGRDRGGGRGRGGGKGQGGRDGYGGGGQEEDAFLSPEGRLFRDITPTIILVDTFFTPEKKSRNQKVTIHRAARKFLSDPIVKDLQSKAYDPYEEVMPNDEQKTRILFHGTRKSRLHNFEDHGVAPMWRANELCAGRAFYVTNSIEQAIAHVLYTCPGPPDLDVDPIIILVFSVDIPVLHGYQPSPDPSITFSVKWFQHHDPEHCQEFLGHAKHNLGLLQPSRPSPTHHFKHIQIGPICLPAKPHSVILRNWTTEDIDLTQVAACSKAAFDFFSNSLVQILEEKRDTVIDMAAA